MGNAVSGGSPVRPPVYHFGLFSLDPGARAITRNGVRVKLQDQPFQLLELLLERSGEVVSREEIRRRLWPENTFVDFDKSLGVAVLKAREALGDDADNPRFIETIPRRGYRFLAPVRVEGPGDGIAAAGDTTVAPPPKKPISAKVKLVSASVLVGAALIVIGVIRLSRMRSRVPEHARVVVGEFTNSTGDPLFDGSLRRAAVIQLAQSPYLTVLSDEKVGEILQDLGRSPDDALTPGLAREVCQGAQAAALITGSIQADSRGYLFSVEADRCSDGSSLARQSLTVKDKQQVVPQLGTIVEDFRRRLGESRESLEKYDVPVEEATTSSLEALKAYQLGLELRAHSKNLEARPALKTAIALDPNFAIAYAQLGSTYSNLGNTAEAKPYFQKAFELRARATEPERLYITGRYFDIVTGEVEKGSETARLWTEIYPNEWKAFNGLANDANRMGRYETVVEAAQRAVQLAPTHDFGYVNLLSGLTSLNRLDEAKKVCNDLVSRGRDTTYVHLDLVAIALLKGDQAGLDREMEWGKSHPDNAAMLYAMAQLDASEGKLRESTELFEHVTKLTVAQGDMESAATTLAVVAETNSEMGRNEIAEQEAERARKLGKNEIVLGLAALVAARGHDPGQTQQILKELDHEYPIATFNLGVYSPMIRTMMAASRHASGTEITSLMEPALPYEFGTEADLLPVYVRAVAYLDTHSPEEARAEFQKLMDHHYVDAVTQLYPLSLLGLARSYAALGRKDDSRGAYEQLFSLWKDADRDLPVLAEARREYAALK